MSAKNPKVDLVFIGTEPNFIARFDDVSKTFNFGCRIIKSVDEYFEDENRPDARLLVLSAVTGYDKDSAAGMVQVSKQLCQDSVIACIVGKRLDKESAAFVKKCGADVIFLEDEMTGTSKLEFVATQVINGTFFPIKVSELGTNTVLPFDIYHFMPLREKFLQCSFSGDSLSEEKIKKLTSVGECYIKRNEVEAYKDYINKINSGGNITNVEQRCRAQYLALRKSYADLVLLLSDQSEYGSFQKGNELLTKCQSISKEILTSLGAIGSAQNVINNTKHGDFGSLERATAVCAYAGLFALQMGWESVDTVMVAALIAETGLIFLPPNITKLLREDRVSGMGEQERKIYENYPFDSIKIALDRKLPLDAKMRDIVLCTHETVNQQGFPRKPLASKVPMEAQLIHFCSLLDKRTLVTMGEVRKDFNSERMKLLKELQLSFKFSTKLIDQLMAISKQPN